MAKTVFTGWRKVTPGACVACGCASAYGCNGSGVVLCSCNPEFDESFDTTEAGEQSERATHWGYGSGMSGCLYDNGPHFVATKEDAIDGALFIFLNCDPELTEEEEKQARQDLAEDGLHYFPRDRQCELGAQLAEIWECDGPLTEEDEAE